MATPEDDEEAEALLAEMSPAIADLLRRMMAHHPHTWEQARVFRDEIVELNQDAQTEEEQTALTFAFTRLMDSVEDEGLIEPSSRNDFKNLREADYRALLMVQAMVGENVDPDRLEAVTRREVEAGRMALDNDFREFAVDASSVIGSGSTEPKRRGWLGRLFGRT